MIHYIRIKNDRLKLSFLQEASLSASCRQELSFSATGLIFLEKCPILFTNVITDVGSFVCIGNVKKTFLQGNKLVF